MANMSYCRFQNTIRDLQDCYENLDAELSEDERKARNRLVRTCAKVLIFAGVEISEQSIKDALKKVDSWH